MSEPKRSASSNVAMSQIGQAAAGFAKRFRLTWMLDHASKRPVLAVYVAINCAVTIFILSIIALLSHEPMVFPSLGPTAFVLFLSPMGVQAAPKNVIIGQLIALVCGVSSLAVFGLLGTGADLHDLTWKRVFAITLALGATALFMVLFGTVHAPAGATVLIVVLGLINTWSGYLWMMAAVLLLVAQAFVINRLAGLPYPLWKPVPGSPDPSSSLS